MALLSVFFLISNGLWAQEYANSLTIGIQMNRGHFRQWKDRKRKWISVVVLCSIQKKGFQSCYCLLTNPLLGIDFYKSASSSKKSNGCLIKSKNKCWNSTCFSTQKMQKMTGLRALQNCGKKYDPKPRRARFLCKIYDGGVSKKLLSYMSDGGVEKLLLTRDDLSRKINSILAFLHTICVNSEFLSEAGINTRALSHFVPSHFCKSRAFHTKK